MSEQVKVDRTLEFVGSAAKKANVKGPMLEKLVHFSDHFTDDTLNTDKWTATVAGSGDTIAIAEEVGGLCTITTGGDDNDSSHLSTAIIWNGTKKAIFETRITIDDVSSTYNFFGLSDAKLESNGQLAIEFPSGSLETNATDAVGFVVDGDKDSSSIMLCGVRGGTDESAIDSGLDWADGETKTLRIILNGDKSTFYIDGVGVGGHNLSQTAATLLCGSIQCGTREGTGQTNVDVHRVDIWQDE